MRLRHLRSNVEILDRPQCRCQIEIPPPTPYREVGATSGKVSAVPTEPEGNRLELARGSKPFPPTTDDRQQEDEGSLPEEQPQKSPAEASTIRESAQEYARGVLGGLLFSLPILFTREVWFTAFLATPERLIAAVIVTFGLLVAFNRVAGLRENASWIEAVVDSVEEFGLGLLISGILFWVTGRFGPGVGVDEAIGLVIIGSLASALGVSIGTAQLGENPEREEVGSGFGGQIVIALCGATIVAANIAPTQEVLTMAIESSPVALGGLLVVTLGLLWLATGFSEVRDSGLSDHPPFARALFAPVAVYGVAMASACVYLWFFGKFDGNGFGINVRQALVLSAPASIGASVGRALIQS